MKTILLTLVITFCTFGSFAQFDVSSGGESETIYCRGTQEVDENGDPIPDDPNCVPDPSVGGTSGGEMGFVSWFGWL